MPEYLRGALSQEDSAAIRSHIEACRTCRLEYEDLRWFAAGLRARKQMIIEGHIDSRLLHEYADCPNKLEPHTIESIASHLRTCDVCREAFDVMKELIEADSADSDVLLPRKEPLLRRIRDWLARPIPRAVLVPVSVAVIAVVVAFGISTYRSYTLGQSAIISVADASMGRGPSVISLYLSTLREVPPATRILRISHDSLATTVLEIVSESADDELAPRRIEIVNEEGKTIFRDQIPEAVVQGATLNVSLNSSRFLPGLYSIKFMDRNGDVVCSGVFEISSPSLSP